MKKLMLLGGSQHQVAAIEKAVSMGIHTILCDYYDDNPGIGSADEFFCISTTDKDSVLKLAQQKRIDAIIAYASEPAVMTAAYVCREMHLPSDPYESIRLMSRKDLFRGFQKENGFNCPKAECCYSLGEALDSLPGLKMPVMVKPVDSSGSKGVSVVYDADGLEAAFFKAMEKSKEKAVLVEEFIRMDHECMIGGDCYIIDGKLSFCGFLNSHRDNSSSPFIPIGTSYPAFVEEGRLERVRLELQRMIDLLGLRNGPINIEAMFDDRDNLYIIEIGHRNGGNMIPDFLEMLTGADLIKAAIDSALGNEAMLRFEFPRAWYTTYVIHSDTGGRLSGIQISDRFAEKIVKIVIYKRKGQDISIFDGANKAIGIIFFKAESTDEIRSIFAYAEKEIRIVFGQQ